MPLVLAPDETGRTRVVSEDDFLAWVAAQPREAGLAIDTETAGLAWNDEVRLVQFGNSERGFAVAVDRDEGQRLVAAALSLYRGPLIFHNSAFDIHRLEQIGIDPEYIWPRTYDTHVLAHVLNPDRMSFKLKMLGISELRVDNEAEKELKKQMRKRKWTWATVPLLVLAPYAVQDTILTHRLFNHFARKLSPVEWDVVQKEMEVRWAVWTCRPLKLDVEYALKLHDQWLSDLEDDREWMAQFPLMPGAQMDAEDMFDKKGRRTKPTHLVNPNSNRQVAAALQQQGWEPSARTPSGEIKLDKKVLETLVGKFALVDRLMEYKRKGKWLAAYVDNCLEEVDEAGYVHASYNTLGAKTGRMSCSAPPLQQLPKGGGGEVRRLFVASEGNVIASVDYSAIEFRLAGALSGEPRIIEVYKAGGDWYQQVADDLGITRQQAKIFVLATLYGCGPKKHAVVFGWTEQYARKVVNTFWRRYPRLSKWVRAVTNQAAQGEAVTSKWGRNLRPHAAYAAPNAIIQGIAAEVLKEGLLRLWEADLLKYVCAIVHDEVVLDVPTDEAVVIAAQVASVLEDNSFDCPLTAEASVYGLSWGDGYAA